MSDVALVTRMAGAGACATGGCLARDPISPCSCATSEAMELMSGSLRSVLRLLLLVALLGKAEAEGGCRKRAESLADSLESVSGGRTSPVGHYQTSATRCGWMWCASFRLTVLTAHGTVQRRTLRRLAVTRTLDMRETIARSRLFCNKYETFCLKREDNSQLKLASQTYWLGEWELTDVGCCRSDSLQGRSEGKKLAILT